MPAHVSSSEQAMRETSIYRFHSARTRALSRSKHSCEENPWSAAIRRLSAAMSMCTFKPRMVVHGKIPVSAVELRQSSLSACCCSKKFCEMCLQSRYLFPMGCSRPAEPSALPEQPGGRSIHGTANPRSNPRDLAAIASHRSSLAPCMWPQRCRWPMQMRPQMLVQMKRCT